MAVGGTWLLDGSPSRPEDRLPFAAHSTSSSAPPTFAASSPSLSPTTSISAIVVYVAGAVLTPGVYTLAPASRVTDALIAAGGSGQDADLEVVNLAATVHDGERIYVPTIGEAVPAVIGDPLPDGTVPAGPVNVNSATPQQLDVLPGVGPATAEAIVAHREQHGPFQSIDQLGEVRGIGPVKLDALRGLVTV
jgi:competence protein ComEA